MQRVPTLEEILAITPEGKRVYVEIKCKSEIVEPLVRMLADRNDAAAVVPISFSLEVLSDLKRSLPQFKMHGVFEFKADKVTGDIHPNADELVAAARGAGLDGVDLDARGPIDKPMVDALVAAGLDVCVWTVDDPRRAIAASLIAAGGRDQGNRGLARTGPVWLGRNELQQDPR